MATACCLVGRRSMDCVVASPIAGDVSVDRCFTRLACYCVQFGWSLLDGLCKALLWPPLLLGRSLSAGALRVCLPMRAAWCGIVAFVKHSVGGPPFLTWGPLWEFYVCHSLATVSGLLVMVLDASGGVGLGVLRVWRSSLGALLKWMCDAFFGVACSVRCAPRRTGLAVVEVGWRFPLCWGWRSGGYARRFGGPRSACRRFGGPRFVARRFGGPWFVYSRSRGPRFPGCRFGGPRCV